jgi:hypothetical protein
VRKKGKEKESHKRRIMKKKYNTCYRRMRKILWF